MPVKKSHVKFPKADDSARLRRTERGKLAGALPLHPIFCYWIIEQLRKIFLFLIILLIIVPSSPAFAKKLRIAVLNFTAKNTRQSLALGIQEYMEYSIFQTKEFEVIDREIIKMASKKYLPKQNGTNLIQTLKLGKILSADILAVGSIIKLKSYIITIKFIDSRDGSLLIADSENALSENDIQTATKKLTYKILDQLYLLKSHSINFIYKKSLYYLGFGIGTGYLWGGGVDRDFQRLNSNILFTWMLAAGGIINKYFHLGIDSIFFLHKADKKIRAGEEKSIADGTKLIINILMVTSYFPTGKDFFIKMGPGFSYSSYRIDSRDIGFESIHRDYIGVGILFGAGYAFWIGRKFNLCVNFDYILQQGRRLPDPELAHFVNFYLSFYYF